MEESDDVQVIQVYHHDPCNKGKGGAVRYLSNLLEFLSQKQIKTSLYGVKSIECMANFNFKFEPIIKGSNGFFRYLLNLLFKLPFLNIDKETIIHVHRIEYVLPFVIFKRNNPLLLSIHGERLATARSKYSKNVFHIIDKIYYILEKIAFKRITCSVANASRVKNSFLTIHDTSNDIPIKIISVGTDLKKFKPMNKATLRKKFDISNKTIIILYVGLLEPRKNVQLLLKAFKLFNDHISDSVLFLVGEGPEKKFLERMVNELDINSNVRFIGEVQNDKLPEFYNLADLFAFTSLSEGGPIVVKEALACGIPVVSTDVGDVRNVIKNTSVGLISDYDAESFSQALIKLLRTIENDSSLKEKCFDAVKSYSFETVADEYIKIYKKLKV